MNFTTITNWFFSSSLFDKLWPGVVTSIFLGMATYSIVNFIWPKLNYRKIVGKYHQPNGSVRIRHVKADYFQAIGIEKTGETWISNLRYLKFGVFYGVYDWQPDSELSDWGEHNLHLLPNGNISVIWLNKSSESERRGRLIWVKETAANRQEIDKSQEIDRPLDKLGDAGKEISWAKEVQDVSEEDIYPDSLSQFAGPESEDSAWMERPEYLDERKNLILLKDGASQRYDQTLTALSTAALGFSIIIVKVPNLNYTGLLFAVWTGWFLTLAIALISLVSSEKLLSEMINTLDSSYSGKKHTDRSPVFSRIVKIFNFFSLSLFITGVLLFLVFIYLNLAHISSIQL